MKIYPFQKIYTYSWHAKFPDYQVFKGKQGISHFCKLKKFFFFFFLHRHLGSHLLGEIHKGPSLWFLKRSEKLSESCFWLKHHNALNAIHKTLQHIGFFLIEKNGKKWHEKMLQWLFFQISKIFQNPIISAWIVFYIPNIV